MGTRALRGTAGVDAGPMAVANEGGHLVVVAPVCHGKLTDVFVTFGNDVAHPLVWHHEDVTHDLRVDLTAPGEGWQGPTLPLSPTATYSVGSGHDVVFDKDFIGSDVWASGRRFTGAEVLALPADQVIAAGSVPPTSGPTARPGPRG
ncbi:hypothetical protein [Kineosporia sp. A_224]|uniref:hypothetical protein n=1 Tax=Kineosporia sp. A_224 TaxID=1962180 RepID=UPI000B4BCCE9|nr:hypothetical protein [Kineosporia sp. A_224]